MLGLSLAQGYSLCILFKLLIALSKLFLESRNTVSSKLPILIKRCGAIFVFSK
jgi:hypothetical protein